MDNSSTPLTPSASSSNAPASSGLPDWMDSSTWAKINALAELEGFTQLASDISAASKRYVYLLLTLSPPPHTLSPHLFFR
jgi:hypothetical protein